MRLEIIDPFTDAEKTERVWRLLCQGQVLPYFLTWGWMENWLATLPGSIDVKLFVVFQADEPEAAFFLGRARILRRKFVLSDSLFLNATGAPRYDALCIEYNAILKRPQSSLSFSRLVSYLPKKWDEVVFPGVERPLLEGLGEADSCCLHIDYEVPSRYVDLDVVRAAKAGYLSLLNGKVRHYVRRSYKYFEARGPVELELASTVESAKAIYCELVDLHQRTWQSRGKSGAFASDYLYSFHERLIEKRFGSGDIQLVRVSSGGMTIGCLYSLVCDGGVYLYQTGFNYESDNQVQPGFVCLVEAIEENARRGYRVFDFLGGNDKYKKVLSTHANELVWARLQRKRLRFSVENYLKRLKKLVSK